MDGVISMLFRSFSLWFGAAGGFGLVTILWNKNRNAGGVHLWIFMCTIRAGAAARAGAEQSRAVVVCKGGCNHQADAVDIRDGKQQRNSNNNMKCSLCQ